MKILIHLIIILVEIIIRLRGFSGPKLTGLKVGEGQLPSPLSLNSNNGNASSEL
jgi:hypothetical protein